MRLQRISVAVVFIIFFVQMLYAASGEIRGRVHDSQGHAVKNATVTVAGTDLKAVSNDNGEFTLKVGGEKKLRLVIESTGYYPATVTHELTEPPAVLDVALTPKLVVTEDVLVVAPRLDVPVSANPAATSVVGGGTIENLPRAIGADEALAGVPGVKVDNQADGERVHLSMRGQGILTERGIRGIEVVLDGLPLNDPSGFVPDLFDVDWAGVQQMEVVRGPVAFLYGGGSSGGVIDIHTRDAVEGTHGGFWSSGGSNAFYKARADLAGMGKGLGYSLAFSRNAGDGYRQHTAFWGDNLSGRLSFNVGPKLQLNVVGLGTGFFNQNAEGLNLTWLAQDRRMANPDALTYNEYQKTVRFTGGLTGRWSATEHQRVSFTFYTRRTRYDEPVPALIDHRRTVSPGGSVQYAYDGGHGWLKHHFSTGADMDGQFTHDWRRGPNLGNAVEGPDMLADQQITQRRFAGFATERLGLGAHWTLLASVRGDAFGNRLEDKLGTGLSGEKNFSRATAHVGATWNPRQEFGLYASWGQGFLPPATEELVNNPVSPGGFNQNLVPATSQGAEVGVRGGLRNRVYYDAAFFRLDTDRDFERYRIPERPLETFYRNAGTSRRYGLETSLKWLTVNRVTLSTAYTYSHFIYGPYISPTYGDITDHSLPNSPRHQLFADVTAELPRSFFVAVGTEAYSRAWVDGTNVPFINGYGLLNARLSKSFQRGRTYGTISINGTNLLAKQYIAFTEPDPDGNSYQPGPEREIFVGLQLRF